jgi:D-sedoheptulose 7-phosphate isomerase
MNAITKHMRQVEEGMTLLDIVEVERLVSVLKFVKERKGTVYLFGNGGSHATASHFANDLMKMAKIKAGCVGDMAPAVMAWGNDTGWENMYYGPLSELVETYDAVIGISCSGNSENVVRALRAGLDQWDVLTACLTGMSDSNVASTLGLDAVVHVRVPDIRVQEDIHLMVCHAVVRALQEHEM